KRDCQSLYPPHISSSWTPVRRRARKQAVAHRVSRLLTRAAPYRRPNRLLTRVVPYRCPNRLLTRAVPSFIMLRVAAPRVPSVRVFIAGFQTDQQSVNRAGVDIAFRERGLERHRMFQRVGEGQRAVMLFDRD